MNLRLAAAGLLAKSEAVGLVGDRRIGLQGSGSCGGGGPSRGRSADIALVGLLSTSLAGLAGLAGLTSLASRARLASRACLASRAGGAGGAGDLALRVCLSRSGGGHLGGGASDVPDVQVCALVRNLGSRDRVKLAGRSRGTSREAEDERLAGGVGLASLLAELGSSDGGGAQRSLAARGGRRDVAAVAGHERAGKSRGGHGGEDDDVLDGKHFDFGVDIESCESECANSFE